MMWRSETGVVNNAAPNSSIQAMHLGYGPEATSIIKSEPGNSQTGAGPYGGQNHGNGDGMSINIGMSSGGGSRGGSGVDGSLKKKRGRPRKYGPDGSIPIPLSSAPPPNVTQPSPVFTITHPSPAPVPAPPLQRTTSPSPPPHQQQQQQTPPTHLPPTHAPPQQQQTPLTRPPLQQQQQQHTPPTHPPLQQQKTPPTHPPQQQQQTAPTYPPQHQQQQTAPTYPSQQQQQQQQHSGHVVNVSPVPAPGPAPGSPQSQPKKTRGRPPGASNKKHHVETLGSPGIGFTPHVIIVKAGEDVSSKIMSFSQNGPRAICILSANGALSNVTLRQAATSGGSVTYEGRFEILSLSGSFMLSESGGHRSRTGGLSVSLAGPDGRVLGGGVAGLLIAASPVQVVVASFMADDGREVKSGNQMEPMSAPSKVVQSGTGPTRTGTGASSPTSHGTLSESSGGGGGSGSPINQDASGAVNNNRNMHGLPWM